MRTHPGRLASIAGVAAAVWLTSCEPDSSGEERDPAPAMTEETADTPDIVDTAAPAESPAPEPVVEKPAPRELVVETVSAGNGEEARAGDEVAVRWSGRLADDTPFGGTTGDEVYRFRIGEGTAIRGLEEGVIGLRPGGRRVLTVPPRLGYGARGVANAPEDGYAIPPGATLRMEVELVEIKEP